MLKFVFCAIFVCITKFGILVESNNRTTVTTTTNPLLTILHKFHQNDYKIAYEWSETVRIDKNYVNFYKHTFKYNRTTTAINMTFSPKIDVGYELQVIGQVYKFASNEYRIYPSLRMEANACVAVEQQIMGFNKFTSGAGNFSCPLLKGKQYHIYNWTPEEANFPPLIPTGKYMLELQFMYKSTEILVTRDYGSIYRPIVY